MPHILLLAVGLVMGFVLGSQVKFAKAKYKLTLSNAQNERFQEVEYLGYKYKQVNCLIQKVER